MRTDSPQIKVLLMKVQEAYGKPIKTPFDFVDVADKIEQVTREHISDSTIKRFYVSKLGYKTVMVRTLDVLSKYVGCDSFESFCSYLHSSIHAESELFSGGEGIKSDEMARGVRVRIAWLPDRECELEYLGERKWKVISSVNASVSEGDTFSCFAMYKGRPLYVANLKHCGETFASYAMGLKHGLSSVEPLASAQLP